ncbi:MAG: methionyl-tRNA formyltransferase [Leucobacter sp.]|jgi:methionyl-tRNA formyltransferase|nr:methionyl-tRNA formyltransferase [Leucobacter sp.]
MRIVFAGTPLFAVPSLHALVEAGHEVVGVITREDAALGRKRVLTPSPVAAAAAQLDLPVYKANRLDDDATNWAASLDAELGVIVAYGGLVREPLLSLPQLGWVNLHFSELPRWRGAAPVQRALMAAEQRLGVTVFRLVAALDAGDVLTRDAHEFEAGTTAGTALTELATLGTTALLDAVRLLAVEPQAGEPQQGEPTYAHKLERADGHLDLRQSADQVLAHWSGVTPEPGAFVMHDGQPLKLLEVRLPAAELASTAEAAHGIGAVRALQGAVLLETGSGTLELVHVQPAGKAAMAAADWLRGRGGEAVLS